MVAGGRAIATFAPNGLVAWHKSRSDDHTHRVGDHFTTREAGDAPGRRCEVRCQRARLCAGDISASFIGWPPMAVVLSDLGEADRPPGCAALAAAALAPPASLEFLVPRWQPYERSLGAELINL
jgi:hypothetical protein